MQLANLCLSHVFVSVLFYTHCCLLKTLITFDLWRHVTCPSPMQRQANLSGLKFQDSLLLHRVSSGTVKNYTVRQCLKKGREGAEGWLSGWGPRYVSQHAHGGSQLCGTSVSGDLLPSTHQVRMWCAHINTHVCACKHFSSLFRHTAKESSL